MSRQTYELWDARAGAPVSSAQLTAEAAELLNDAIMADHGPDAPLHWRVQGSAASGGSVTGAVLIDYRIMVPGDVIPEIGMSSRVWFCPVCQQPGVVRIKDGRAVMCHREAQFSGGRELRETCDLTPPQIDALKK